MSALTEMAPAAGTTRAGKPERDQSSTGLDSTLEVPLVHILVADRYRKDLGDVSSLAESIQNIGLINPVTVVPWHGRYRLVAGERRMTAFRNLGLTTIPVRVATDIADARDALVAERDENTERKEMLPSERVALGMAIEAIEAPKAAERKRDGQIKGGEVFAGRLGVPRNTKPDDTHRSRDIAADAVDMSPASYTRVKTVVNLAADETQPVEVREAARDAVEAIDAGAPVRREYDKVKNVRRAPATKAPPASRTKQDDLIWDEVRELSETYITIDIAMDKLGDRVPSVSRAAFLSGCTRRGITFVDPRQYRVEHDRQLKMLDNSSGTISTAVGILTDAVELTTITTEEASEALERLEDARADLRVFINRLKEVI